MRRRFLCVPDPSSRLGASLIAPAFIAALALGCGGGDSATNADSAGQVSADGDDDGDDGDDDGGDETVGPSDGTVGGDTMGGDGMAEAGSDGPGDTAGPGGFIENPDGGGPTNECDIWSQDCPEGEKCMPWANDGGGSWNATRCTELDENPGQPGDECTVEGSGVSGIDTCDVSSMCWDVDGETNTGVCTGFCEGDQNNSFCSDPDAGCSVSNDGVLILCLPFCDPLLQDCGEGGACYPEAAGFFCSPDASGEDAGGYSDACEFLNVCDPGLWCADASAVPGCAAAGCCSEFCDAADPDAECQGAGQTCVTWWAEGEAPPGEEDFGVCIIEA